MGGVKMKINKMYRDLKGLTPESIRDENFNKTIIFSLIHEQKLTTIC